MPASIQVSGNVVRTCAGQWRDERPWTDADRALLIRAAARYDHANHTAQPADLLAIGRDLARWLEGRPALARAVAATLALAPSASAWTCWSRRAVRWGNSDALKHHVPNFDKAQGMFRAPHEQERLAGAIKKARVLVAACATEGWDRWRNPSMRVHLLVTHLLVQLKAPSR